MDIQIISHLFKQDELVLERISSPEVTSIWATLSKVLPKRNGDLDWWWDLTGQHLSIMMEASDYDVQRKYEALLFHYHWVTPYLGPRPHSTENLKWKSILGIEGSPIEYSFKWNTKKTPPVVRLTLDAIANRTGPRTDPMNQEAAMEMLSQVSHSFPEVNLTWVNYLLKTLYDDDREKYVQEAAAGVNFHTTIMSAVEFNVASIDLKTYFIPRHLGQADGPLQISDWESYLRPLSRESTAFSMLLNFLQTNPEGKSLHAIMVAVDDVEPSQSRLKLYFHTSHTSFKSVRRIMTLGNVLDVSPLGLQDLKTFVHAVHDLPKDFSEDKEMPLWKEYNVETNSGADEPAVMMGGYQYYFDIAPEAKTPDIKFFTPARRYGPNDRRLANGITDWMADHGRGQYCDRYIGILERLAPNRKLENGKGMQTFIGCLIKKDGELDVTSYIGPQAFDRDQTRMSSL